MRKSRTFAPAMEAKKSRKADLERGWFGRFALGLVVALSCLFVGLNYSIEPDDPLDDPDLLDMFSMDEDLSSLMRPEDELALAPKAEPEPAKKLVVAEEEVSEPLTDDEPVETDMNDDMSALDEEEPEPPKPEDDDVVSFRVVEDLPQFPGGAVEMMKWLQRNLKYPPP